MKAHRFELGKFPPSDYDDEGNFYIDWPAIHKQAGKDCIRWLKSQDPTQCQLIVEKATNDYDWRMIAEIYSDNLATIYSLMWAK